MRIAVIPADSPPRVQDVPDSDAAQLAALQKIVGGYIQVFIMPKYPKLLLVAREFDHPAEEAHAALNTVAESLTGFPLRGECVVVGQHAPSFISVPDDLLADFVAEVPPEQGTLL